MRTKPAREHLPMVSMEGGDLGGLIAGHRAGFSPRCAVVTGADVIEFKTVLTILDFIGPSLLDFARSPNVPGVPRPARRRQRVKSERTDGDPPNQPGMRRHGLHRTDENQEHDEQFGPICDLHSMLA